MIDAIRMPALLCIVFQFLIMTIACSQRQIIPSQSSDMYAKSIIDHYNVKDKNKISNLLGPTSFPSTVNHEEVGLGDGWVIVDMGKFTEIIDAPGPDLRVYESDFNEEIFSLSL